MTTSGIFRQKAGFAGERLIVLPPAVVRQLEEDPLTALLHITDIGYFPKALHHYRERLEPISQYVFIYCLDGRGWFEIDGRRQEVAAGEYFVLPPGKAHRYGADDAEPWTICWMHFKGDSAPLYAPERVEPMALLPAADSRISERLTLFDEIFATLSAGYSRGNLLYVTSMLHHFLGSCRFVEQYRAASGGKALSTVEMAVHYMRENLSRKLTVEEIAGQLGCSAPHFAALFKEHTGRSPINYFLDMKVQLACGLLDTTDLKVNQICCQLGIDDPYYFSRLFKRQMGVSPRSYRQVKKG